MRAKRLFAWSCLAVLGLTLGGCGRKTDFYALLAEYSDFNRDDAVDIEFAYDFEDPRLAQLDMQWGLREIAGEGDTQSRALNLMHWLCAHTIKGNPESMEGFEWHAQSLLDWCYDQPESFPNCMQLSIILSECLLAVGIKAYALWCFPKVYVNDNHVVVQVWLPEEQRWIMLDPSFNLYVMDESGRILDAPEFRQKLAERIPLRLNDEITWNGDGYLDYMAKDLFYFWRKQEMHYGALHAGTQRVYLCPAGYELGDVESPIYATYDSFWR